MSSYHLSILQKKSEQFDIFSKYTETGDPSSRGKHSGIKSEKPLPHITTKKTVPTGKDETGKVQFQDGEDLDGDKENLAEQTESGGSETPVGNSNGNEDGNFEIDKVKAE